MRDFVAELGIEADNSGVSIGEFVDTEGDWLESVSPIDNQPIARVRQATVADYDKAAEAASAAFKRWREVPPPVRGEVVRQIAKRLREKKDALGQLVTLEMGKIVAEGGGEVQEMIDIADFAVGLSRQLYGLTIASERPEHRMAETWHPLGPVGVISAFNFPVAVWSWNAFIAAVCGDTVVWKPSPKTPLTAIAVQRIVDEVLNAHGHAGVMTLAIGPDDPVGETMIRDRRLPLISATGSCRMGRHVGPVVAERFGRCLLELGGNNALVVMDDADLDLAVRAVVFGAVGTTGQRCTTTRRLLVQESIADAFVSRVVQAFKQVRIGNPLEPSTMMGPLIDASAVEGMRRALAAAKDQGGDIAYGGATLEGDAYPGGLYVEPCVVRASPDMPVVKQETFAPILYALTFKDLDEAIALQNDVDQGLSSAIFTDSLRAAERFLSATGSDCGIANVNIGTTGAEVGGAFGGEKETGGGREAGSDSWKAYMRRQTQTINRSKALPLAQGIQFG